ncbi:MAG: proline-rich domain-containing protein [bacterium]|nr:proline-rich domain-containing protein [bacterium]
MKTKHLASFIILGFLIIGSTVLTGRTFAEETTKTINVQYPVNELGGCKNETDCRFYCDKPGNAEACLDFAQENNLMSEGEINAAKNFLKIDENGPGGCKGKEECEEYCSNTNHIDECISFAEENNLIPPEELEEARKVQAAIRRGFNPPPCGNKKRCDIYCDQPEHMEECITFGIEAGFIQGEELNNVQKMLAAIKKGVKPPPCRGKEACDKYCGEPDNMEVCMTFAMEAGFMTEQEKADSQKMLQALKKGIKPPNCRGKEECDVYCGQEEHFEECINFAEAAGFMTSEDAAMARKTKGKGPGGCKNKEECEAFCNNPDNQEACFNFAKENGMIPEEDLRQMEESKQKLQESLNQAPPAVLDCLNSVLGSDMVEKIKSGQALPPRETNDQMRACFEKMRSPAGEEGQGQMPPGQTGPDGPNGPAGPQGCQSPTECQAFCENNPQECQNFGPQSEGPTRPEEPNSPMPPNQQLPIENPPPPENPPPSNENPPAGLFGPNSLLGSVANIFLKIFNQ